MTAYNNRFDWIPQSKAYLQALWLDECGSEGHNYHAYLDRKKKSFKNNKQLYSCWKHLIRSHNKKKRKCILKKRFIKKEKSRTVKFNSLVRIRHFVYIHVQIVLTFQTTIKQQSSTFPEIEKNSNSSSNTEDVCINFASRGRKMLYVAMRHCLL